MATKKARKGRPVSKTEFETLAEFRYALRQFMRFSEEAAQSIGLSPQQHQALLAVKGFPGRDQITISELAERLQIQHHSAVGLVNRLVARRLMTRKPGEQDRRQVYVLLTAQGTKVLDQLSAAHKEELQRLGSQVKRLLGRLTGKK